MTAHIMVSESKSLCGRLVTQGTGRNCGNCARIAKSRGMVCRVEGSGTSIRDSIRTVHANPCTCDKDRSDFEILADLLSLGGGKNPATVTVVETVTNAPAETTEPVTPAIDLFNRAKFVGYSDDGAARVADVFDVFYPAPFGDECDKHPAMRRFDDGECESCTVVAKSDALGYVPMKGN